MKQKALEQFRSGKSLFGKDGAFAPLLKSFLEAALDAEMETHLDADERLSGNRRNGKITKQVKTSRGTISVDTPRDRTSSFEPELIKMPSGALPMIIPFISPKKISVAARLGLQTGPKEKNDLCRHGEQR